jgi:hypothetical protein
MPSLMGFGGADAIDPTVTSSLVSLCSAKSDAIALFWAERNRTSGGEGVSHTPENTWREPICASRIMSFNILAEG